MAVSQAMIGYGTKFQIERADSPNEWDDIAEVINVTPPNFTTDQVDVTHNQSPNRTREFIPGLIDPGEASFEMNFVPSTSLTSSDRILQALRDSGDVATCRIVYPNDVTWEFFGSLTGYEITSATEDKMTATVTIKVSGSITVGTL